MWRVMVASPWWWVGSCHCRACLVVLVVLVCVRVVIGWNRVARGRWWLALGRVVVPAVRALVVRDLVVGRVVGSGRTGGLEGGVVVGAVLGVDRAGGPVNADGLGYALAGPVPRAVLALVVLR